MIFGIAHNLHPATAGDHQIAFGHALRRVISSLGVNIRPQKLDHLTDIWLIENCDRVNVFQSCQNLGAFVVGNVRTPQALQRAGARVRVHRDNHSSSELFGRTQVANVPDMKQVEAAVGKDDSFSAGAPLSYFLGELGEIQNFLLRLRQSALHHGAQQLRACHRCRAALHHHDPSGIVGQARRRFGISSRSQSGGVGRNHRITGSGDIGYLV